MRLLQQPQLRPLLGRQLHPVVGAAGTATKGHPSYRSAGETRISNGEMPKTAVSGRGEVTATSQMMTMMAVIPATISHVSRAAPRPHVQIVEAAEALTQSGREAMSVSSTLFRVTRQPTRLGSGTPLT